MKLLDEIKENWKLLLDFIRDHAIEIHVKRKSTEVTDKTIKISNSFFIFILLIIVGLIYLKLFI